MASARYDALAAERYETLVSRAADFRSTGNFLLVHHWCGLGLRVPDVLEAARKTIEDFHEDADRLRETRDSLDPLRHKCNGLLY